MAVPLTKVERRRAGAVEHLRQGSTAIGRRPIRNIRSRMLFPDARPRMLVAGCSTSPAVEDRKSVFMWYRRDWRDGDICLKFLTFRTMSHGTMEPTSVHPTRTCRRMPYGRDRNAEIGKSESCQEKGTDVA
jgi:hypothetical protein